MACAVRILTAPIESRFPSCHSIETIVGVAAAAMVVEAPKLPPVAVSNEQAAIARNVLRRMEPPIVLIDPPSPESPYYSSVGMGVNSSGIDDGRTIVLDDSNLVADGDGSAAEDVGVDARAVEEVLDQSWTRHRFQMAAGLTEAHGEAFHVTDPEPLTEEVVQADVADGDLPAGVARLEARVGHGFLLHERQGMAGVGSAGVEVPVPFEAFSGDGARGVDRPERAGLLLTDVDRDDRAGDAHAPSVTATESRRKGVPLCLTGSHGISGRSPGSRSA